MMNFEIEGPGLRAVSVHWLQIDGFASSGVRLA
jgi:hypothetical protein